MAQNYTERPEILNNLTLIEALDMLPVILRTLWHALQSADVGRLARCLWVSTALS